MTTLNDLYRVHGQSPWIDNIRRDWLNDGTLARLVAQGVRGVTSNPSIFAKALSTSSAYDDAVRAHPGLDPEALFEALAVEDVRDACDVLAEVHDGSRDDPTRRYRDGYVSLEVSPLLARDTDGTTSAARRLFAEVDRPNVMIKIPATREGLPAITTALGEGINVNVTLIFSLARYAEVLDAWVAGLTAARAAGKDLAAIASVASFFVSRVDVAVDALLPDGDDRRGTVANAQAAAAYGLYRERVARADVSDLLAAGAQVQRPLWASTSTKNPAYDDLLYVNRLVASETVNTMPDATIDAYLDHGDPSASLLEDTGLRERAAGVLETLAPVVDLDAVTNRLEDEGVAAFASSYRELLATLEAKAAVTR
ncbi:MAG TPA: transaldolase [Acidimicrobiales bacterium]|nr:transaldolase [Acidimicrobiales bacterium]